MEMLRSMGPHFKNFGHNYGNGTHFNDEFIMQPIVLYITRLLTTPGHTATVGYTLEYFTGRGQYTISYMTRNIPGTEMNLSLFLH